MSKILFTILVVFAVNISLAQTSDTADIKKTFEAYFTVLKKKDNAAVAEFLYPSFFKIVPKEELIASFDKMYADTGMVIDYDSSKVLSISEVKIIDSAKYALVDYTFTLILALKGEDSGEIAGIMLQSFEKMYGDKNVFLNKETTTFYLRPGGKMYFIKDKNAGDWKLVEKKDEYNTIMNMILPEKVLKAF